jgi:hypothetical protein
MIGDDLAVRGRNTMPAEPQELGELGSDVAAALPGPALVMAAADPQPEPEPVQHRAARHALHAVGEGSEAEGVAAAAPEAGDAEGREVPAVSARAPRHESVAVADLRRRLELLPYGHPSSPYHDDGERKPPPPRLKHLELAPPVKTSITRNTPAAVLPSPELDTSTAGTSPPAATPRLPPHPSVPPLPPPAALAEVATSAPAARIAPDGSWSWGRVRLSRDLIRAADDAYDRFRAAEGRDLFGHYGQGGLTPMLSRVAERTARGELAADAARYALLDPDEFRARFAEMLSRHPDRSPEQLARRVPGALSYSFLFDDELYAEGIANVQEALELQGFQLRGRWNTWSSAANRCVLTVWHDPLTDLPFQVQFHTRASLEAQHLARTSAALINDPRIPSSEADDLRSEIRAAWAALPAPPGNADIADYRRDGNSARR